MVQPLPLPDNFTTQPDATNAVPKAVSLTVVPATPESLASIVTKAGNQASLGGDNSSLPITSAEVLRTPVAEIPVTPTPIPPSTVLLGSGLVALLALRKSTRKALV